MNCMSTYKKKKIRCLLGAVAAHRDVVRKVRDSNHAWVQLLAPLNQAWVQPRAPLLLNLLKSQR